MALRPCLALQTTGGLPSMLIYLKMDRNVPLKQVEMFVSRDDAPHAQRMWEFVTVEHSKTIWHFGGAQT